MFKTARKLIRISHKEIERAPAQHGRATSKLILVGHAAVDSGLGHCACLTSIFPPNCGGHPAIPLPSRLQNLKILWWSHWWSVFHDFPPEYRPTKKQNIHKHTINIPLKIGVNNCQQRMPSPHRRPGRKERLAARLSWKAATSRLKADSTLAGHKWG